MGFASNFPNSEHFALCKEPLGGHTGVICFVEHGFSMLIVPFGTGRKSGVVKPLTLFHVVSAGAVEAVFWVKAD